MKHRMSITSIGPISLGTRDYTWRQRNDWGTTEIEVFRKNRSNLRENLYLNPAWPHKKTPHSPEVFGQWLLETQDGKIWMWAEAQWFRASYSVLFLFLGRTVTESVCDIDQDATGHLLSALLIQTKSDIAKLIYGEGIPPYFGTKKQLLSPQNSDRWLSDPKQLPIISIQAHMVHPFEWWETERGVAEKERLNYLAVRVKRTSKSEARTKPRKTGLLGRLFRPRV